MAIRTIHLLVERCEDSTLDSVKFTAEKATADTLKAFSEIPPEDMAHPSDGLPSEEDIKGGSGL